MVSTRPVYRPPGAAARSRRLPPHVYWRRRAIVVLARADPRLVVYLGVTLAVALTNPSYGVVGAWPAPPSGAASTASAGRHLGRDRVVQAPPGQDGRHAAPGQIIFGERPDQGRRCPTGSCTCRRPPPSRPRPRTRCPARACGTSPAVATANGVPGLYEAFVRPDAVHTSYVVGVAWMDPTVLRPSSTPGRTSPAAAALPSHRADPPAASRDPRRRVQRGLSHPGRQRRLLHRRPHDRPAAPRRGVGRHLQGRHDDRRRVGHERPHHEQPGRVGAPEPRPDRRQRRRRRRDSPAQNTDQVGQDPRRARFNVWRSGLGVTKRRGHRLRRRPGAVDQRPGQRAGARRGAVRAMELDINTDWVQYSPTSPARSNTAVNGANGTNLLAGMIGRAEPLLRQLVEPRLLHDEPAHDDRSPR